MSVRYATGAVIGIETNFQDATNTPIITADGKVKVRRLSDDLYADDASGVSWSAAGALLSMTKIDDTNSAGWWKFDFDTSALSADDYIFTVTDANTNAANTPQHAKAIVGDYLSRLVEASGHGEGKVVYNPLTSVLTVYKLDDPATVSKTWNCKDKDGNPAGSGEIYQKIPV